MSKGYKTKKFVVCPNCGKALFKKKFVKKHEVGRDFCPRCYVELPDAYHKASGKKKKKKD